MEIKQTKVELVFNLEELASLERAYEIIDELVNTMIEQDYQKVSGNNFGIAFDSIEDMLSTLRALTADEKLEVE